MIPDLPVPRTAVSIQDIGILPVSRLAACSFLGCEASVRFLQLGNYYALGLCESHGHEILEEAFGMPVQFGEPLGYIATE